ncbi:MAG TPA: glycosyltransferase [Usitatibacteraceae bacterium]|nr:glycosyltransferase [Usitatibacteraceae bacterium]
MPRVTLIVPVHNAAGFLEAGLAAILSQDFADFELLAIDDGSADASAQILARAAAADSRVRVLQHAGGANRGVAASRNRGLDEAAGDYVWMVDADDRVAQGALRTLVDVADRQRADVVAFNAQEVEAGARIGPLYRQAKPAGPMSGRDWVALSCRQKECRHLVWLRFYRHEYLLRTGLRFREGIVHEDIAWITEGDLAAERFCFVDAQLYEYHRHPASITMRSDDAMRVQRALSLIEVVGQLRDINRRHAIGGGLLEALRHELCGQGVQVAELWRHVADRAVRRPLDEKLAQTRFWRALWADAVTWTRKRQLLQILWRSWRSGGGA